MSLEEIKTERQRLALLQVLEAEPGYAENEAVLQVALEAVGYGISSSKLRDELTWLAERRLITVEIIGALMMAKLTRRGDDVAQGRERVPGVARQRLGG
jgi:hypothetical protein